MQKWNIPTDRAQRMGEKNRVICLVITFTPGIMVIKNVKNGSFFVSSANVYQKFVTV